MAIHVPIFGRFPISPEEHFLQLLEIKQKTAPIQNGMDFAYIYVHTKSTQNRLLAEASYWTGGRCGPGLGSGIKTYLQEVDKLLCDDCYHELECSRQPDENGRCSYFIKNSKVEIDNDVEVNPMDTLTYDYDDIKKLFEDRPIDLDDLPEP